MKPEQTIGYVLMGLAAVLIAVMAIMSASNGNGTFSVPSDSHGSALSRELITKHYK